MNLDNLTGLEIIQGIIHATIPHPAIATIIPMQFVEAEAGQVKDAVHCRRHNQRPSWQTRRPCYLYLHAYQKIKK